MLVISARQVFLKMNKYEFNIGDEVITADGFCGEIINICECDRCKERGFLEPVVEWQDGNVDWITDWNLNNNFNNYYKIGDYIFGNIHLEDLKKQISRLRSQVYQLEDQRDFLMDLIERRENNLE